MGLTYSLNYAMYRRCWWQSWSCSSWRSCRKAVSRCAADSWSTASTRTTRHSATRWTSSRSSTTESTSRSTVRWAPASDRRSPASFRRRRRWSAVRGSACVVGGADGRRTTRAPMAARRRTARWAGAPCLTRVEKRQRGTLHRRRDHTSKPEMIAMDRKYRQCSEHWWLVWRNGNIEKLSYVVPG